MNRKSHLLKKTIIALMIVVSLPLFLYASSETQGLLNEQVNQQPDSSLFEKGSRVCFIGNSITNHGSFHRNVRLYYVTRFPDHPVSFYNCGISGDIAWGMLNRMDDDILVHRPTHAVIMVGMNDVKRSLYGPKETADRDTLQMREQAIEHYKKNLEKIVTLLLSKNIEVILQKPSIYDQTAALPTPNNFGVNDALKTCAGFIDTLAARYDLPTVDYWTIMTGINKKLQAKDPSATVVGRDRVHPGAPGHLVMAYQFLKSTDAPHYVSRISIGKEMNGRNCWNCEIRSVKFRQDGVSFTARENALPFPVSDNQKPALDWIPFTDDFNTELLEVNGLKPGTYSLTIDSITVGSFTHTQLREGINLAEYEATPQYRQALEVRHVLEQLWEIEGNLRSIKFMEYNKDFKAMPEKKDLSVVKVYLDSVFTENYHGNSSYYKSQLEKYIENKPFEHELMQKLELLGEKAYLTARPGQHVYVVKPLQSR